MRTEYQECVDLARWLDARRVIYTHVPMGGYRRAGEAYKLKAIGTKAGVPDYLIFSPSFTYSGIAIEMKRQEKGRVSFAQKQWLADLELAGWSCHVCAGFEEARIVLTDLGI